MGIKEFFENLKTKSLEAKKKKKEDANLKDYIAFDDNPNEVKNKKKKNDKKHKNKFYEKMKEEEASQEPVKSEIEQLTTTLMAETEYILRKKFNQELNSQLESNVPLERDYAINTINNLIRLTISQRNLIIGRIEKDIETGNLYKKYYGKLETVNELTEEGIVKYRKMQRAKEKWEYNEAVYEKIRAKSFKICPEEHDIENIDKKQKSDILKIMDTDESFETYTANQDEEVN